MRQATAAREQAQSFDRIAADVSDRCFSREELERCCAELFPGCRLGLAGRPRVALIWDAPRGTDLA